MPRWVWIIIGTPLALCAICGYLFFAVIKPHFHAALEKEMANAVATSVSESMGTKVQQPLVITPADLNVNNSESSGECGFTTSTSGTTIYGVRTGIDRSGITIVCGGMTYSGKPIVKDGRVDLTEVKVSSGAVGILFPKESFETGMENGINRALEARGMTPTQLTLYDGWMTIRTESSTSDLSPARA
jgi:hypothetical protein